VKDAKTWQAVALSGLDRELKDLDKQSIKFPAQQFVRDIDSVILAKDKMTRRQWVSVLESILRLACATHVLWLCDVNARIWRRASAVLAGTLPVPTLAEVRADLVTADRRYLAYGNAAIADIRQYASNYLVSRLGLNALLWAIPADKLPSGPLDSCTGIEAFLGAVQGCRDELESTDLKRHFHDLTEREARTIAGKRGIGRNIVEFVSHTLQQRQAADETLRGYDQGYVLRKRGGAKSGPWTVYLGPVSVLALVHSCLREAAGPRSVRTLCEHLAAYGVEVDLGDVSTGELGKQLRMLGLVLDSPDAESGILLVPPF
jgi:hypothetical protein